MTALETTKEHQTLNTYYDHFSGGWGWRWGGGFGDRFGDATTTEIGGGWSNARSIREIWRIRERLKGICCCCERRKRDAACGEIR
jgi:hypothetical protein